MVKVKVLLDEHCRATVPRSYLSLSIGFIDRLLWALTCRRPSEIRRPKAAVKAIH
jgi:hypothetical protein